MILLLNLILLKYYSSIIVFPFKKVIDSKFNNINSSNSEYNSTHFLFDNYNELIYTTIKIGDPPQEVNAIITYNDCNFKIGKARKCISNSKYLSHYNSNLSKGFNYTDYYSLPLSEFGNQGHSAEDTIFAYTDLNLKKLSKFEKIGFYLGSNTNDELCCVIGFRMPNYATFCSESNNIIKSFKSNDIINNYEWILNYTSENEGLLILGGNMSELVKNFDEIKLYKTYSFPGGSNFPWMIKISKLECGENNYSINYNEVNGEINNDYSLIIGGDRYYIYIKDNFFYEYQKQNICSFNIINYYDNYKYYVIECNKEQFGINEIKKFPILSFKMRNYDSKFIFEGKDLFVETKYKYFFNIIFSHSWQENWILGKPFLKKYPTMIDLDNKIIKIYNNNKDERKEKNEKKIENNKKLSKKYIFFLILIIIVLICSFSILFYLLGKNLNKSRKKKANELYDDDYDYESKDEKENKVMNLSFN